MQCVEFMNLISFLTKTIHFIIDNIKGQKAEVINRMWVEENWNISSTSFIIVIVDIKAITVHFLFIIFLTNIFNDVAIMKLF